MAIKFERTTYPGNMNALWREPKVMPGGFAMKQAFPVGEVILRGAFVAVDVNAMEAAIVKVGKVLAGGTTSAARVSKRNNLCPGDTVMKVGGTATTTVKSVDRSNPEYDVIEVVTAISDLVEGDFLQEADAQSKAPKYVANAVLASDLEIRKGGLPTIDAAHDAVVLKAVCTPFPTDWLVENGFCLKTNHNIVIINQ